MPINFHDERNRTTYTTRIADESWVNCMEEHVVISNKHIADIGCGGGIYSKALADMGAASVTGVDFSEEMLKGAIENCKDINHVSFLLGDAYHTNMPANRFDIVLERALIHHLNDLNECFQEAARILKKDGLLIVQDRTPQDCSFPGDENHIRGYFHTKYPKLIEKEMTRRHQSIDVRNALESNGFRVSEEVQLWETRRVYDSLDALKADLLMRTGRSILHELTDDELHELVLFILGQLKGITNPIVEKDCWTVWFAIKN
ncbi:class I SAM-dependent methyltransferase [Paenibacillus albus]|uniref:Class I SAM-dependent methyltransferase n=1 Tax=Paenibacillus albus TaxID=2495582 RepID=A0A3Q8X5H0_9BACL|nr:class I SAM-dependent methyltransferase [Paenibacillus albus]AZN40972.1 class I SAM-dependent methyltransferase [Paenibacillus albus]